MKTEVVDEVIAKGGCLNLVPLINTLNDLEKSQ